MLENKRSEVSDIKLFVKAWLIKAQQKSIKIKDISDNMSGLLSDYMEMSCYEFLQQEKIKAIDLDKIYPKNNLMIKKENEEN